MPPSSLTQSLRGEPWAPRFLTDRRSPASATFSHRPSHYPLEFRLFRKPEVCEALKEPFRNHTALVCELIDWVCQRQIPGDFAMDCYFTCAEILNHIHSQADRFGRPRGYVGDLKTNRKVEWKGSTLKASELARSIPP